MDYALGILIGIIVQLVKKWFGTSTFGTYITLAFVSLVGAIVYVYFSQTSMWETIVKVILTASSFHNLIIRRIEK